MSVTLTIRDETAGGKVYHELPLEFPSERITVRELIRERVYQEVQDFNRRQHERFFRGLVQPTEAERVLNGRQNEYRLKTHRQIDWKEQFDRALDAFTHNGFFIFYPHRRQAGREPRPGIRYRARHPSQLREAHAISGRMR